MSTVRSNVAAFSTNQPITDAPDKLAMNAEPPSPTTMLVKVLSEKRTRTLQVLFLISILVVSLHACGWLCLKSLIKPTLREKPFIMEAAIIPVSVSKPRAVPPPPPPAEMKHPQKPPRKHKIKAAAPLDPEPSEFAQITQIHEAAQVMPLIPDSAAIASNTELPTKNAEHLTEVTIDTHHADNPKPNYPTIALRQGWQGQVMLRVQVNEAGIIEDVTIERSSGYDLLDESAVEAVKQWHFNPAKRGDMAVASSVNIPIVFMIDDQVPASV